MTDLEEKLIEDIKFGRDISLERGLLIVSELKTEEEIETYRQKLGQIYNGFISRLESRDPIKSSIPRKYTTASRAKLLFDYLWNTKPRRCNSNFLLTDVVDAQLDSDINRKVGTCVGLTSLFTVLGLRENLNLTILISDSHIANRLRIDETSYDIDNTDPLGFNCDLTDQSFLEYPVVNLIANVLNSRGMAKERNNDLEGAIQDYEKACKVNPIYANAHNNRGNILLKRLQCSNAIKAYDMAINSNPSFVEAYCNRGMAKQGLGDYLGAINDYDRAIQINPEYVDAYFSRGLAKEKTGDLAGAEIDYNRAAALSPELKVKIDKITQSPNQNNL